MGFTINTTGANAINAKLNAIANGQLVIERAAVGAAVGVLAGAARKASPGTVTREVGGSVRTQGNHVVGRAGLTKFPRRGVRYSGKRGSTNRSPHGIYLEVGTRYIAARRFVSKALAAARPAAESAAARAAQKKIQSLAN